MRFAAVNGGCFVLDVVLLLTLHYGAHVRPGVAAAIAFALASVVNFVLSRQWVFARTARGGNPRADLARYVALVLTGLMVTWGVVSVLTAWGWPTTWAKLAASGMVGLINFVVMPRWIFAGDRRPVTTGSAPEPATVRR